MKNDAIKSITSNSYSIKQFLLAMKLTSILLVLAFVQVSAEGLSQNINIEGRDIPIKEVIKSIEKQSNYTFFYDVKELPDVNVSLNVQNASIDEALNAVFNNLPTISYKVVKNNVVITTRVLQNKAMPVIGYVYDQKGLPIPGVNVIVKGRQKGSITDAAGSFKVEVEATDTLVFTFVGMKTLTVAVNNQSLINVVMEDETTQLEEVVVTGIVTRKAESFTGSVVTTNKEKLLNAGNQNILQSLKNIDPSFKLEQSLSLGSDPNKLPEIVLRGKSNLPGMSDDLKSTYSKNANQPLFILDGFETSLQTVYDLDMNRVKSITILKDASAKAIYGAKAANGVVVIETQQPKKGTLQVSYTGNLNIEAPDLSGYNLMNAKEKLKWEKDHNMYDAGWDPDLQSFRQELYNERYQDVYLRGVNTYWLAKPLQTGVGQKHSLSIEGGDDYMRYGADFSFNDVTGVMKGSGRKNVSGNTILSYRYKNVIFRNNMGLTQNKAENSPYGSFSDYVALNPYWTPRDENGKLKSVLGFYPTSVNSKGWVKTYNPLYNASLNIIDESKYTQLMDNFSIEWNLFKDLKVTGSLGYTYQKNSSDKFLPPDHTDFISYTDESGLAGYKGKWTRTEGMSQSVESNTGVTYNQTIGKHFFMGNATLNLSDGKSTTNGFVAEGFSNSYATDISMASHYERAQSPTGSDSHIRSVGVVGIFNYSYDNRYFIDANYRTSASSIYGKNNRWGSFWSVGAGWNIHNEEFVKKYGFIEEMKLRGSMGYTGSQNADAYLTLATYDYNDIVYDGKKGVYLLALPNPDLQWQKKMDYNVGLDLAMFKKLSLRFDLYNSVTTNLLEEFTAAPSLGFGTYRANLGKTVNTGFEFSLGYQIFSQDKGKTYLNVFVTGLHNKNKIKEISKAFKSYNDKQDAEVEAGGKIYNKPYSRYYEGQSLTAIWAMKSLGIDPVTGKELFLDKNGKVTDIWSADNLIIAGDTEPDLSGSVGVNMGYKGFTLSLSCSYKFGGQMYNSTLVERVENIDGYSNLDRRILDSWQEPGDRAIYKKPQVSSSVNSITYTKPTTRFVQDDNELYFSSMSLGYDVQSKKLLSKMGMERLRFTFYTNELLRISSVRTERGTDYPFARNFSFSLQTTF